MERKHGKKKRMKLHFAINTVTHEGISMEVSTDDLHDVKALPGLVEKAEGNMEVSKVIGDGAYDSGGSTLCWRVGALRWRLSLEGTVGLIRGVRGEG